ncbi:MAG TPA: sodium:solute symporter family protein [Terracidiphilus sp.]|nr:sodium:solute symporter family protein [Terracidiphilus sp.]
MFGLVALTTTGSFTAHPSLLALDASPLAHLRPLDIAVIAIYFAMVIWIGFYLKGLSNTSEDFFMAGREMTAWIAGLSFVSANLGSLELMGWAGSAYQYGILATHWYWIGAIPAMIFLGLVMMPFYYVSKTHSVPGYLKLRFGEHARVLAAISFATEMILMSGVNMFAMAVVMKVVLGWNISFSILVSAFAVTLYVALGGLRSAIFNEVLQFVLIWAGALLVPILGLMQSGGFEGLKARIIANLQSTDLHVAPDSYIHLWRDTGHFASNPMGVHWTGIVFGLGFVISFGYWTTDFLVVQRVLAAHNLRAARMAPIIGSFFKMAVPFIVILPGLLGLVLLQNPDGSRRQLVPQEAIKGCAPLDIPPGTPSAEMSQAIAARRTACENDLSTAGTLTPGFKKAILDQKPGPALELHSFNEALPLMMVRYMGPGLLGLGITALIAGFMSGMAGNVSAFSTVWTYDLYKPLMNKKATDSHYVMVGRMSIVIGVAVSIGAAYLVMHAAGIMDYVQALFSIFIAPLLGTILLGMFWKRATALAGFLGLLIGIAFSASLFVWVKFNPAALATVALSPDAKPMAENVYRALWAFLITVVIVVFVSLFTKPKPVAELNGLVYGATVLPTEEPVPFYKNEYMWAILAVLIFAGLNILFW